MTSTDVPGSALVPWGPGFNTVSTLPAVSASAAVLDAVNESAQMIGYIVTSDGASHTIDTTGSSSIQWMAATSTVFADAGTTVKVGLAALDSTTGFPPRAVNVADVVTYDVVRSMTGGSGGITANAWQTHVPNSGTKTIANGDFIALVIQMTARGGTDQIRVVAISTNTTPFGCTWTAFTGSYASSNFMPNAIISFSDGALGYFYGCDIGTSIGTRTYNSGSSPNEYGQLYTMPVPGKIAGIYGWADLDGDCSFILYSDPLGTPVAERTVAFDLNWASTSAGRRGQVLFPTPYSVAAGQSVVAAIKPTSGTSMSAYYKTINNAAHRVTDIWGTTGYGVSRSSGAFANANSSLDHYYVGLLFGAYDNGVGAGGGGEHFGGFAG